MPFPSNPLCKFHATLDAISMQFSLQSPCSLNSTPHATPHSRSIVSIYGNPMCNLHTNPCMQPSCDTKTSRTPCLNYTIKSTGKTGHPPVKEGISAPAGLFSRACEMRWSMAIASSLPAHTHACTHTSAKSMHTHVHASMCSQEWHLSAM